MNQDNQSEVIERIRREAFEEAAKVADQIAQIGKVSPFWNAGQAQMFVECAERIRALSRPSLSTPSEGVIERLLDSFESAVRVNEDFHIAGTSEATIEVVLSDVSVKERRAAILQALARLSPLPLVEEKHG